MYSPLGSEASSDQRFTTRDRRASGRKSPGKRSNNTDQRSSEIDGEELVDETSSDQRSVTIDRRRQPSQRPMTSSRRRLLGQCPRANGQDSVRGSSEQLSTINVQKVRNYEKPNQTDEISLNQNFTSKKQHTDSPLRTSIKLFGQFLMGSAQKVRSDKESAKQIDETSSGRNSTISNRKRSLRKKNSTIMKSSEQLPNINTQKVRNDEVPVTQSDEILQGKCFTNGDCRDSERTSSDQRPITIGCRRSSCQFSRTNGQDSVRRSSEQLPNINTPKMRNDEVPVTKTDKISSVQNFKFYLLKKIGQENFSEIINFCKDLSCFQELLSGYNGGVISKNVFNQLSDSKSVLFDLNQQLLSIKSSLKSKLNHDLKLKSNVNLNSNLLFNLFFICDSVIIYDKFLCLGCSLKLSFFCDPSSKELIINNVCNFFEYLPKPEKKCIPPYPFFYTPMFNETFKLSFFKDVHDITNIKDTSIDLLDKLNLLYCIIDVSCLDCFKSLSLNDQQLINQNTFLSLLQIRILSIINEIISYVKKATEVYGNLKVEFYYRSLEFMSDAINLRLSIRVSFTSVPNNQTNFHGKPIGEMKHQITNILLYNFLQEIQIQKDLENFTLEQLKKREEKKKIETANEAQYVQKISLKKPN